MSESFTLQLVYVRYLPCRKTFRSEIYPVPPISCPLFEGPTDFSILFYRVELRPFGLLSEMKLTLVERDNSHITLNAKSKLVSNDLILFGVILVLFISSGFLRPESHCCSNECSNLNKWSGGRLYTYSCQKWHSSHRRDITVPVKTCTCMSIFLHDKDTESGPVCLDREGWNITTKSLSMYSFNFSQSQSGSWKTGSTSILLLSDHDGPPPLPPLFLSLSLCLCL